MGDQRVAIIGRGFGGLAVAIRLQAAGASHRPLRGARSAGRAGRCSCGGGSHVRPGPDGHHGAALPRGAVRAGGRDGSPITSGCCRSRRSIVCCGATARASTTAARPTRCARRWRRWRPRISAGSSGSWPTAAGLRGGVRRAGRRRLLALRRHGPRRAAAGPPARRSLRLRRRQPLREGRTPAPGALVSRLAHRRQSLRDERDLHADPLPRAQVGRLLSAGRNRRAGAGAGRSLPAARRRAAARRAGRPGRRSSRAAVGRSTSCPRRARARPSRSMPSSPTPISTTPTRASMPGRRPPRRCARDSSAWPGRCRWWSSISGRGASIPGGAHHTVLFGPRYREMLREIFHGPSLPADFSLYLHQPTVTDPSLAPPGGETFYVLAPVPHLGAAAVDWSDRGRALREPHPRQPRDAASRPTAARSRSSASPRRSTSAIG